MKLVVCLAAALLLPAQTELDRLFDSAKEARAQGRLSEAERLLRLGLAEAEKLPDDPRLPQVAQQLADLLRVQGKPAEAAPLYRKTLPIEEKRLGPDNTGLIPLLTHLAWTVSRTEPIETEALLKRALSIQEKASPDAPFAPELGEPIRNLAAWYQAVGQFREAETLFLRGLIIREKASGPAHADLVPDLNRLAFIFNAQKKLGEAEYFYVRSLGIAQNSLSAEHPQLTATLDGLAALYRDQRRFPEAEPLMRRAIANRETTLGPSHPEVASALDGLAWVLFAQRKFVDAESSYTRSLAIWETVLGPDHPSVATSLDNLAVLYATQEKFDQAGPLYRRALAIREKETVASLNNLAMVQAARGETEEARGLYALALTIGEKGFGAESQAILPTLETYASLLRQLDRKAEADRIEARIKTIRGSASQPESRPRE